MKKLMISLLAVAFVVSFVSLPKANAAILILPAHVAVGSIGAAVAGQAFYIGIFTTATIGWFYQYSQASPEAKKAANVGDMISMMNDPSLRWADAKPYPGYMVVYQAQ